MAQLRHDYGKFQAENSEVLVIVPNGPKMIERYVSENDIPYPIVSDRGSKVAERYGIKTRGLPVIDFKFFKPTVFLVDSTGTIVYTNYSDSYTAQPDSEEPLAVLAGRAV